MNRKLLDVLIGVTSLVVLLILLELLPLVSGAGIGYTLSLVIYIAIMSGAGWIFSGHTA